MQARLSSRHLVGRIGELAELELGVTEATDARPVLVLLGGESGVGKTRLVGELAARLADQALVLRGEAVEQANGELPYAPLLGALRPLVRESHPALQALSRGSAAQLATLVPGLADGLVPDEPRVGSGQLRLFEALLELFDLASEPAPAVLILEDMHWADRSTRTFVAFLARSLRQERLMVLLTYRTDELHRRHPLRPLLSELDRLERVRRIDLEPFDRGELAEALTDILGETPDQALLERLFARGEGNPLFTEELLAAGLDGRGAAPQSLRDAFMLRIERLPETAQLAARAIAVGRGLTQDTITEVTGLERAPLQGALREAVAEQILIAAEDGELRFRHALLRETVYDDLLPGERGELHLALARVLEARTPDPHGRGADLAATIAGHYAAAGDQPRALQASVRAARRAGEVQAYGESADLAERALELWPRVADAAELTKLDHLALVTMAADAHGIAGDRARAEVLLERALSEVEPGDERRRAGLLARLARVQWSLNRGMEGVDTANRALAILPEDEPTRERATLLAWLARTYALRGRLRDALRAGEEALSAAISAGDRRSEGEVLNTLGMVQIVTGGVDEGVTRMRRALEISRADEELEGVAYVYGNLSDALNLAGRTPEALEIAKEGLDTTPRRMGANHEWLVLTISELAFEAGDWRMAEAHLTAHPDQLVGTLLIFRWIREADLALGVGDEDRAARVLQAVEPLVASASEPQWIGVFGALLGDLRRRRRDLLGARAAVADALDRLEVCTDDVMRIARVSAIGARIEADIAQRARDLKEQAQERDALARARLHVGRLRAAASEGGPVERAWREMGAAELTRARGRSDPGQWLKAAGEWDSVSRPYPATVARWRAAEALVERGERAAAADLVREALQTARRLDSTWLIAETTALADRGRLGRADPAGAGNRDGDAAATPHDAAADDPFGLTPRERQVLALLAEGATNRQIGTALYMAEKTASVHVSRILGKLGVQSRTQAAALAHRLRLAQ